MHRCRMNAVECHHSRDSYQQLCCSGRPLLVKMFIISTGIISNHFAIKAATNEAIQAS